MISVCSLFFNIFYNLYYPGSHGGTSMNEVITPIVVWGAGFHSAQTEANPDRLNDQLSKGKLRLYVSNLLCLYLHEL